jgi:hypothetical protein
MDFSVPLYDLNSAFIHSTDDQKFFEENLNNLSRSYMTKDKTLSKKYLEKLDEDLEENFIMNKNFILRYKEYDVYFYNNDGDETNDKKKVILTYKTPDNKLKVGLVSGYNMIFEDNDDNNEIKIIENFTVKRVLKCPNKYLAKIAFLICLSFSKVEDTLLFKIEIDRKLYNKISPEDQVIEEPLELKLTGKIFECPISLCDYDTSLSIKTKCGHIFNKENLKQWTEKNNNCPLCRASLD